MTEKIKYLDLEGGSKDEKRRWVVAINEDAMNTSEDSSPAFCRLKHPKSGEGAMFLFTHNNTQLYEVLRFEEPFRSWFVGDSVERDGSMMITTPMDPIFLVLQYLANTCHVDKYQVLDQLLNDEIFHETQRLCSCVQPKQLQHVADVKGDSEYKAYRYNKDKTLTWLRRKVERVADGLAQQGVRVSGSATSSFVSTNDKYSRDDYIKYAYGMVSDYLSLELSEELRNSMGIIVKEKRSHSNSEERSAKRPKTGNVEPAENYSSKAENQDSETKGPAKSKLDKVDKSGMKSISSFFAPKAKKQ